MAQALIKSIHHDEPIFSGSINILSIIFLVERSIVEAKEAYYSSEAEGIPKNQRVKLVLSACINATRAK